AAGLVAAIKSTTVQNAIAGYWLSWTTEGQKATKVMEGQLKQLHQRWQDFERKEWVASIRAPFRATQMEHEERAAGLELDARLRRQAFGTGYDKLGRGLTGTRPDFERTVPSGAAHALADRLVPAGVEKPEQRGRYVQEQAERIYGIQQ